MVYFCESWDYPSHTIARIISCHVVCMEGAVETLHCVLQKSACRYLYHVVKSGTLTLIVFVIIINLKSVNIIWICIYVELTVITYWWIILYLCVVKLQLTTRHVYITFLILRRHKVTTMYPLKPMFQFNTLEPRCDMAR